MAHTCPVWLGYLLNIPLRKLWHNPKKVLKPHVEAGMTAMDVGCAMGFFTLSMADLVGPEGKVVAVDLQAGMITRLRRRAECHGIADRLEGRICTADSLNLDDLTEQIDFALAWFVIHEIPDRERALREIYATLKTDGTLLLAEPAVHVRQREFEAILQSATQAGFEVVEKQSRRLQHKAILRK